VQLFALYNHKTKVPYYMNFSLSFSMSSHSYIRFLQQTRMSRGSSAW